MLDFHTPYRYTRLRDGQDEEFCGYIVGAMPYRRTTSKGVLYGVAFVGIGADPLTRILFHTSVLSEDPSQVVLQASLRPDSRPVICVFRPVSIQQYQQDEATGLMWGFKVRSTTDLVVALQSDIPSWWEKKFTTQGAAVEP